MTAPNIVKLTPACRIELAPSGVERADYLSECLGLTREAAVRFALENVMVPTLDEHPVALDNKAFQQLNRQCLFRRRPLPDVLAEAIDEAERELLTTLDGTELTEYFKWGE